MYKEQITAPNLPQPATDTHLIDLKNKGSQSSKK